MILQDFHSANLPGFHSLKTCCQKLRWVFFVMREHSIFQNAEIVFSQISKDLDAFLLMGNCKFTCVLDVEYRYLRIRKIKNDRKIKNNMLKLSFQVLKRYLQKLIIFLCHFSIISILRNTSLRVYVKNGYGEVYCGRIVC